MKLIKGASTSAVFDQAMDLIRMAFRREIENTAEITGLRSPHDDLALLEQQVVRERADRLDSSDLRWILELSALPPRDRWSAVRYSRSLRNRDRNGSLEQDLHEDLNRWLSTEQYATLGAGLFRRATIGKQADKAQVATVQADRIVSALSQVPAHSCRLLLAIVGAMPQALTGSTSALRLAIGRFADAMLSADERRRLAVYLVQRLPLEPSTGAGDDADVSMADVAQASGGAR